jgi:lantibiotic modifying enzyme
MPGQSEKHLCGYGHGAGGIGCALLELWSRTQAKEFRTAALESFRYERSHFSPEHHNWPDLRNMTGYGVPDGQAVYAVAWCHGGPGIGLGRLRAHKLLPKDSAILGDLNEALQLTASACSNVVFPQSGSLCLCHGLGGNADLLIETALAQPRPDLRQIAESVGRQAIEQIQKAEVPWPCGVNGGGETPNLMLGLAGIGHFFLRLHDPGKVGSLLALDADAKASVQEQAA